MTGRSRKPCEGSERKMVLSGKRSRTTFRILMVGSQSVVLANFKMSRTPLLLIVKFLFTCPTQRRICLTERGASCVRSVLYCNRSACECLRSVCSVQHQQVGLSLTPTRTVLNYDLTNCSGFPGFSFCSLCGNDGMLFLSVCVCALELLLVDVCTSAPRTWRCVRHKEAIKTK